MRQIVEKINGLKNTFSFILGEDRRKIPLILVQIFLALMLDIIGIGLILPFLTILSQPEMIETYFQANPALNVFSSLSYKSLVVLSGFLFLIMFFSKSIFSLWVNANIGRFAYDQDTKVRVRLLSAYLFCNYELHLETDRASIFNAMIQNINKFSIALVAVLRFISEGMVLLFLTLFVFFTSPISLIVVIGGFIPIMVVYFLIIRKRAIAAGELSVFSNKNMYKHIQESIEGMKEIRVLGAELAFLGRLREAGQAAQQASTVIWTLSLLPRYFLEITFVFLTVFGLFYISWIGQDIENFIPQLGLMGLVGLRLMPSIGTIMTSFTSARSSLPAVTDLEAEIREAEAFLQEPAKSLLSQTDISPIGTAEKVDRKTDAKEDVFSKIEFKDVRYSYHEQEQNIFDELNLSFKQHVSTGIIGPSGSGKTTLMNLLLGFLQPRSGDILLNGEKISDNLTKWHKMLAYIPQFTFLCDDTIRRNVALGLPDEEIEEVKVLNAINLAQLDDFVDSQALGLDTIIGDSGLKLSGGQRQRLAIARALYFDRQVLIFDEATSALDQSTEERILKVIYSLKNKVTIFIVSHRPATLALCDQILKVSDGNVYFADKENIISE